MTKFGIGQAAMRREDHRLITGQGQYLDDLKRSSQTYIAFVRSPHAHAKIVSIDTVAATSAPGVVAVITGADLLADGVGAFPMGPGARADGTPMTSEPLYALATDAVRFVGQTVAAVIAQSRLQAEDAAESVLVEYDELPVVATLEAALKPGAPLVSAQVPGNVAAEAKWGNAAECDAAFSKAKHVTKLSFHNQRLVPVSMEPRGTLAEYDAASGRITMYTSCQNPAGLRDNLANAILKVPPEKVRVRVGDVGGGFGMKTLLYPEDAVIAYAAKKIGRTVRWEATRSEEFLTSSHGRDQYNEAELAFDGDGKVLGFRVRLTGNIGAYAYGPGAIINVAIGPKVITGVYHIPAFDLHCKAVLTHTNVVSAYRGAGRPEAIYLIERLMDQAAAEMNMDPAEVRRRNLIPKEAMPYKTPMGEVFDSGDFANILKRGLEQSDWSGFEKRRAESKARGRVRGRALSTFLEWTGVVHEETVKLEVTADGKVMVYTAMQAMGQGIETSYVQILAEKLGVNPDAVVIVQGDSDVMSGLGSMGSRSLYIGGSAMMTASGETIEKGKSLAADALEAAAGDIEYRDGQFKVAGTDLGIGIFELAGRQPDKRISVTTLQKVDGPSWPNSCHVCEVEVDTDTGVVDVVKYTTVDDVGRVVNPMIVAGQVHGGIAQAIGQALMEDTRYDPESGQLLTGTFLDYCVPRADDVPDIAVFNDESQLCKINPLGAKGVGELGTVGGTPTIVNAVLNALRPMGVKHLEMPLTSERVWRAIQRA